MTDTTIDTTENLLQRLEQINEQAIGRSCDDLEFRPSTAIPGAAEVYLRHENVWAARVPSEAASLEILDALAAAVRIGTALGRVQGKREIGAYLRQECGL